MMMMMMMMILGIDITEAK